MRKDFCRACFNEKHGIVTRIPFWHTCGKNHQTKHTMQNPQIEFEVLLKSGPKAGQTVTVVTDLETLEEVSLSTLLIKQDHLTSWTNDEYKVVNRSILQRRAV